MLKWCTPIGMYWTSTGALIRLRLPEAYLNPQSRLPLLIGL
jgi:hypothetical protein